MLTLVVMDPQELAGRSALAEEITIYPQAVRPGDESQKQRG